MKSWLLVVSTLVGVGCGGAGSPLTLDLGQVDGEARQSDGSPQDSGEPDQASGDSLASDSRRDQALHEDGAPDSTLAADAASPDGSSSDAAQSHDSALPDSAVSDDGPAPDEGATDSTADGSAVPDLCPGICTVGETRCVTLGQQTCELGSTGCPAWSRTIGCPWGHVCENGACELVCGDGVVSSDETCDVAIISGAGACPASCPRLDPCVERELSAARTCQAQCVETAITSGSQADLCCLGDAQDPDCASDYPVSASRKVYSAFGGMSCSPSWDAKQTSGSFAISLPPSQCALPVALTVLGSSPGLPPRNLWLDLFVSTVGADYAPPKVSDHPNSSNTVQTSFLIGMSDVERSLAKLDHQLSYCTSISFHTEMYLDARPLAPVETGVSAQDVKLVGDVFGQYLISRDGAELRATQGRLVAGQFNSAGFSYQLEPTHWQSEGSGHVSSDAIEFAAVSEPRAALDDYPGMVPNVHVASVNGAADAIRISRVTAGGTASAATVLHQGLGISDLRMVAWDEEHLGLLWVEQLAGKSVLRLARATFKSSPPAIVSLENLTDGSQPVSDPDLAASLGSPPSSQRNAGAAWVVGSGASAKLYFRPIDSATGKGSGSAELVSSGAVAPKAPQLLALSYGAMRIAWLDSRSGTQALYLKDNLIKNGTKLESRAFALAPDARVSPDGHAIERAELATTAARLTTDTPQTLWIPTANYNMARLIVVDAQQRASLLRAKRMDTGGPYLRDGEPMPLSCNQSTAAGTVLTVGDYYLAWGPGVRHDAAHQLAFWVENGEVVLSPVGAQATERVPF